MPLAVARRLRLARSGERPLAFEATKAWLVEPVLEHRRPLWIWGAGHVGRAIVGVMAPLPGHAITWIDTAAARFPDTLPGGVTPRVAADLPAAVADAPADAAHLVLTYSHEIDFALCHRLLGHGFRFCGLIGSATKWARFRSRLAALGHAEPQIARITCPIGDTALGKHPQAIAIGVAAALLAPRAQAQSARDTA